MCFRMGGGRNHMPSASDDVLSQYGALDSDVVELPSAMRMRIDRESREWLQHSHPGLPNFLRTTLQVSSAAFAAVKRLCYDRTNGEWPAAELSSAVAPLARTFLDSLISVSFVRDQPFENLERYYKGGLCAVLAQRERMVAEYGDNPDWSKRLASLGTWIDLHEQGNPAQRVVLSEEERADPRSHARKLWPGPGRLIAMCSPPRRDHLQFLRDWFYDDLSQDAHMYYMGVIRRAVPLHEETPAVNVSAFRSQAFYGALEVYLALLAEIADAAKLNVERGRIAGVWERVARIPGADQLWNRHYHELLTGAANPVERHV